MAAAFAALSGAHVAFSRMALTDVSFLLIWVLALIQGQRFLERPGAFRAVLLGVAVGAAQLFKYNGWLAGATVVLSAAFWLVLHPGQRRSGMAAATWGWGLLAALVAAIVYWPWFAFVQSHGGYGALLAHQRGYLGGLAPGPAISRARLRRHVHFPAEPSGLLQPVSLRRPGSCSSALTKLTAAACLRSSVADHIGRGRAARHARPRLLGSSRLAAARVPRGRNHALQAVILIYAGWLTVSLLTPFYHPYARLWLPLEAFECVFFGGVIGVLHEWLEAVSRRADDKRGSPGSRPNWFASLYRDCIRVPWAYLLSARARSIEPALARACSRRPIR